MLTSLLSFMLLASQASALTQPADEMPPLLEASGAAHLGAFLYIAGDETSLGLWRMDVRDRSLSYLGWEKAQGKLEDIEGVAALDADRLVTISSLSKNKKGKIKPGRNQIAVVKIGTDSAQVESRHELRDAMIDFVNAQKALAQKVDDVNVEGVALAPTHSDGTRKLYLGLRMPQAELAGKPAAAVVVLDGEPLARGAEPRFQDLLLVPTAHLNSGVRDLTWDHGKLYVLLGPNSNTELRDDRVAPPPFELMEWDGKVWRAISREFSGFSALTRPEGIAFQDDGTLWVTQDFKDGEEGEAIVRLSRRGALLRGRVRYGTARM